MEIDVAIEKDGGPMGDWLEHNHNTFQRIWISVFGIANENGTASVDRTTTHLGEEVQLQEVVVHRLAIVLPEMDELEIRKHIEWYLVYCQRREERKHYVQAWRRMKDMNVFEEEKKFREKEAKRIERNKAKEKEKTYKIQESRKYLPYLSTELDNPHQRRVSCFRSFIFTIRHSSFSS